MRIFLVIKRYSVYYLYIKMTMTNFMVVSSFTTDTREQIICTAFFSLYIGDVGLFLYLCGIM